MHVLVYVVVCIFCCNTYHRNFATIFITLNLRNNHLLFSSLFLIDKGPENGSLTNIVNLQGYPWLNQAFLIKIFSLFKSITKK
jgi:hypothetical protein